MIETNKLNQELQDLEDRWHIASILKSLITADAPTIVVAGAYKGLVVDYLATLYPSAPVLGYEPQGWAYEVARERNSIHKNAKIYPYGLGVETKDSVPMGEFSTDACSFLEDSGERGFGNLEDAALHLGPGVDLLVINMEGYEYKLLPYLLRFAPKALAVQFHTKYATWNEHFNLLFNLGKVYGHEFTLALPQWGLWWN